MDSFQKKTLTTSRSLTYTYYVHPGSNDKPAIVLQHGFPDSAHMYQEIVPYLIPTGYPMLIPDLLGYAGTSKPTDPLAYNSKAMATDLIEICDAEGFKSLISLGHDWGSFVAQRLYLFYPERVVGLILLNVAYLPPDQTNRFSLQPFLKSQEEAYGHPLYAYWELFTAPDGAEILNSHLESFWAIMHGDEPNWMERMWCKRGAMREFLEADKRVPLKAYAKDSKWRDEWISRMQKDGLNAPLQYYCAFTNNVHFEDERKIPAEVLVVKKPVLFVGCTEDGVCRIDWINIGKDLNLLPNLTEKVIQNCAHWSSMEKPEELGPIIASYLQETKF